MVQLCLPAGIHHPRSNGNAAGNGCTCRQLLLVKRKMAPGPQVLMGTTLSRQHWKSKVRAHSLPRTRYLNSMAGSTPSPQSNPWPPGVHVACTPPHPTPPQYPTKLIPSPLPLCSALSRRRASAAVIPTAWMLFLQITLVSPPLPPYVSAQMSPSHVGLP